MEFSELTRSRVKLLYGSGQQEENWDEVYDRIMAQEPVCTLNAHGKQVNLTQLRTRILADFPYLKTRSLCPEVREQLLKNDDKKLSKKCNIFEPKLFADVQDALNQAPVSKRSCFIELVKLQHFDGVTAYSSSVKNNPGKKPPYAFFPPRFTLDVGDVEPCSKVRINTGYVVRVPNICQERRLKDGTVSIDDRHTLQPSFIIVPQFLLNDQQRGDVVPCLSSRDPEDTGVLTFSVFTRSGHIGKLSVVLKAYVSGSPRSEHVYLLNSEVNDTQILKNKDFKNGRYTANLKVRFEPTSAVCEQRGNNNHNTGSHSVSSLVLFDTYNTKVEPHERYERQRLVLNTSQFTVLLSSRKREWWDENLVTTPGVYTAKSHVPTRVLSQTLLASADATNVLSCSGSSNTHCCSFIESKASLFSVIIDKTNNDNTPSAGSEESRNALKLYNGAFYDLAEYPQMIKYARNMVKALNGLQSGVKACRNLIKSGIVTREDMEKLIMLYDHHQVLKRNTLRELIAGSEKQMYECRISTGRAYSVLLDRAIKFLATYYWAGDLLDERDIEALRRDDPISTAKTTTSSALKRPSSEDESSSADNIDNDSKRQKI